VPGWSAFPEMNVRPYVTVVGKPGVEPRALVDVALLPLWHSRWNAPWGEIHHAPWALQAARVELTENTMADPLGLSLDPEGSLAHFSRQLDVVTWLPSRVEPEEWV